MPGIAAAGLKLLSIYPENPRCGLPVLSAVVLLVDVETGKCSAVVEAGLLTAYRTAAASAVATQYLSRTDARVLGLVGAGIEARTHLDAIRLVRPIERVVVWSRTHESANTFATEMADRSLPIDIADDVRSVVEVADILCTLTPAPTPIVQGAWFRDGLHVNAVGTHWIDKREVDTEAIVRSRVVVDSYDANVLESGDLMIPVQEGAIDTGHFSDEIGEIIIKAKPARMDSREITMYQSVGVAIQDVATAAMIVDRARSSGVGLEVELW